MKKKNEIEYKNPLSFYTEKKITGKFWNFAMHREFYLKKKKIKRNKNFGEIHNK